MHGERTGVDFAFRIQETVKFLAGGPAIQDFHASDFDDPMPGARFESGGFHVEDNLSHRESLKDHCIDRAIGENVYAFVAVKNCCATTWASPAHQCPARVRALSAGSASVCRRACEP